VFCTITIPQRSRRCVSHVVRSVARGHNPDDMSEPTWLTIARELQAIAQSGIAYTDNAFDRERYERVRELAASFDGRGKRAQTARGSRALFGRTSGTQHRRWMSVARRSSVAASSWYAKSAMVFGLCRADGPM